MGGVVAVSLGLTLGYILITKPLGRLQRAIGLLKQRDFRSATPATGLPEFDRVLAEFNDLSRELAQAEELRKNLISDTSHELKTPIQSLMLQVQGMRDGLVPKNEKQFEQLLDQVGKLDQLTEQLQEYARLRSRIMHINVKPCELLPLVRKSAEDFKAAIDKAGISIVYEVAPHFTVWADRMLLERVFTNLFRNTITHAQASTITIRARGNEIIFMDNGRGVGQEHISHLFERFYRIKSRHTPGLGLGLGIVQDAIEAHGWKIWAVSNATSGLEIHILPSSVKV
jgi:signal transduction histidine kinase